MKTCAEAEAFIRYVTDNPESEKVFHVPQRSHDSQLHLISRDRVLFPKKAAPLKNVSILGSIGASNKQGVVQIQYINGSHVGCTGYMITLNARVTAAHCVGERRMGYGGYIPSPITTEPVEGIPEVPGSEATTIRTSPLVIIATRTSTPHPMHAPPKAVKNDPTNSHPR